MARATSTAAQILQSLLDGPPVRQRPVKWTHSVADLSPCGLFRYRLERRLGDVGSYPPITFIMLNPSIADDAMDDPTIRKCWGYTLRWNYSRMVVVNMFAYRNTDPRYLANQRDPVGPDNLANLRRAIEEASEIGAPVMCAWGCAIPKTLQHQERVVIDLLNKFGRGNIMALRLNARGQPWHPLYLPYNVEPVPFFESLL